MRNLQTPSIDGEQLTTKSIKTNSKRQIANSEQDTIVIVENINLSNDKSTIKENKTGIRIYLLNGSSKDKVSTLCPINVEESGLADKTLREVIADIEQNNTTHKLDSVNNDVPRIGLSSKLTCREHEILHLIGKGLSNKLIARELDISDGTVKVHVKHLLKKLNLKSRVEAAVWIVNNQVK